MSDFRILYPGVEDTENFISQQMQVAHVRVRSDDDPRKQEQVVGRLKQRITQFIQFCDNQHRLAGQQHSHFRVSQDDVEMQYINNTGQPLVYISPPVSQPEEPLPEDVVVDLAGPPVQATAVIRYRGFGGELSSTGEETESITIPEGSSGGGISSPEIDDPRTTTALIYLEDVTDEIKELYTIQEDTADSVITLNNRMKYLGLALGYAAVGVDGNPVGFEAYSRPAPLFVFGVSIDVDGSVPESETEQLGGTSYPATCTFTQSFPADDESTWPPPGPVLEDGTPAGDELEGEDRPAPLEDPFNPDNVLLCVQYDVFPTQTGDGGRKRYSINETISVDVFLIDAAGPTVQVTSGNVSISDSGDFSTSPASNRLNGAFEVFADPTNGWVQTDTIDGSEEIPYATGTTTKERLPSINLSTRGFSNPMRANLLVFPDQIPVLVDETVAGPTVRLTEGEDREVDEEQTITTVDDPGFLEDADGSEFQGSIRFEFSSLPNVGGPYTLDGWYLDTDLAGGITEDGPWGKSLL